MKNTLQITQPKKNYYCENSIYEVIQVACEWGFQNSTFIFNAFTYLARLGKKTKDKKSITEDLTKAKYYIEKEIELIDIETNQNISYFPSVKLKSMIGEKKKLRQNVNLIMGEWGYGTWFKYQSADNEKFFIIHKDTIKHFKNFSEHSWFAGIAGKADSEQKKQNLIKILDRIKVLIGLMNENYPNKNQRITPPSQKSKTPQRISDKRTRKIGG
jgi:hypothetical protein